MATERDWQAIRDWVARVVMHYWLDADSWFTNEENELVYVRSDRPCNWPRWQPDHSPVQAFQLMDAMRAAGWHLAVDDHIGIFAGRWEHSVMGTVSRLTYGPTFPEWVTLSAARATGYEEE